mmetsp:Transcript_75424/g.194445  ORF Transcript_75424/g.194445 Transcript_75424/m.194445 type:complete len:248 (+) Transcript_75424:3-746(+)
MVSCMTRRAAIIAARACAAGRRKRWGGGASVSTRSSKRPGCATRPRRWRHSSQLAWLVSLKVSSASRQLSSGKPVEVGSPKRREISATSDSKPTGTGSMQKRAASPHMTRRLSMPRFRAAHSSEASVLTPSVVATSSASSKADATASQQLSGTPMLPLLLRGVRGTSAMPSSSLLLSSGSLLSCACGLSKTVGSPCTAPSSPPSPSLSSVARRLSKMAAQSTRSASMRTRSSLSRASSAPEELPVAS